MDTIAFVFAVLALALPLVYLFLRKDDGMAPRWYFWALIVVCLCLGATMVAKLLE
ncbi:hypothetical protein ACFQ78_37700 [Streptomyces sp. NPDC056519]|uniref:hypothetical protein n=1 Tax=Streptomyces sp. NPDC056519 TaxID=3345849 RepID=UPI0036A2CA38